MALSNDDTTRKAPRHLTHIERAKIEALINSNRAHLSLWLATQREAPLEIDDMLCLVEMRVTVKKREELGPEWTVHDVRVATEAANPAAPQQQEKENGDID